MTAPAHFKGFAAQARRFFEELAANNNADWFRTNKAAYERDVRGPMADLIVDLDVALAERDVPLTGDPKTSIFRINRDVRFSKDKSPYKTNISGVLSRDGGKRSQGMLYLQLGLDGQFAAMGFYALESAPLSAMRDGIVARRDAWREVVVRLDEAGLALNRDDALARLPRGYDADDVGSLADTLRLKSFVVSRPLDDAALDQPSLVQRLADFAASGLPLLEFGWRALENLPAGAPAGRR